MSAESDMSASIFRGASDGSATVQQETSGEFSTGLPVITPLFPQQQNSNFVFALYRR